MWAGEGAAKRAGGQVSGRTSERRAVRRGDEWEARGGGRGRGLAYILARACILARLIAKGRPLATTAQTATSRILHATLLAGWKSSGLGGTILNLDSPAIRVVWRQRH